MARHRAFPLFEQRDSGHPYEPHSPETLITLGTWRIQRIQIWEKRNFQFTAPLDVCLRLWYDLCFRKQTDAKCTFVHPDKGETLLERCHGCVYPWAVCVDNNLLDKHTVTSPQSPTHPPPTLLELSSSHKAKPLPVWPLTVLLMLQSHRPKTPYTGNKLCRTE